MAKKVTNHDDQAPIASHDADQEDVKERNESSSENVTPRTMLGSCRVMKFGDYTLVTDGEESEDEEEVDDEDIEPEQQAEIRDPADEDVEEEDEDDDEEDDNDQLEVDHDGAINQEEYQAEDEDHEQNKQPPVRSQKQLQQLSHQHHIQLLMNALEKLNPDKNGLAVVPKEITSSTLTTRLKGVCKINRIIDHSNDLCHSFTEVGAQAKYQESTDKFRNWILRNRIIEHIFGPNCHVEIIKQSHTILNFVAQSLNDEHVNVIWSASLLKHCGRQVLDLLTSLIRFMRTGPVLHLYLLVKNLGIEDHSEHTLLLTSHILRYIWSHSPCINQIQFASLHKTRHRQQQQQLSQHPHRQQQQHQLNHIRDQDCGSQSAPHTHHQLTSQSPLQLGSKHKIGQSQSSHTHNQEEQHSPIRQNQQRQMRISNNEANTITGESDTNSTTVTASSVSNSSNNVTLTSDQYHWLATCMFTNSNNEDHTERSVSSRSTSESVDMDKDLQQSLLDAIKGVTQNQQHQRAANSPVGETIAKGKGDGHEPADEMKRNVVDHILKSITDSSPTTSHREGPTDGDIPAQTSDPNLPQSSSGSTNEREWLSQLWRDNGDFLDNTSDVSACCSEEKNMDDFEDDVQDHAQQESNFDSNHEHQNPSHGCDSIYSHTNSRAVNTTTTISPSRPNIVNVDHMTEALTIVESTSSRESDTRLRGPHDHNTDQSNESITQYKELKRASCDLSNVTLQILGDDEDLKGLSEYNLANLCEPGKTLLWDLLQDGKIEHLAASLHVEMENVLVNLVMSFGDRFIRYRFIEACLENLSAGTSVIISLRLLPKLLSFNTLTRNLSIPAINETHTIVLWAEREFNMSKNFFKNLVDYYEERELLLESLTATNQAGTQAIFGQHKYLDEPFDQQSKGFIFTHIDKIITRMSFLTFIYSKPFSPEDMKLSREQMDQLWDCLASDVNPRCSDVLFQWIYQQAVGDDFHGVNDELLDYVLKHKLPTLDPRNFRLRGLKLLEQLLWIRQDYECCHGLEHPATRLLWDIGLQAHDDEVGMAAIRILNHFYIYTNHQKSTKCDKGINFMNHCMEQLESTLTSLTAPNEETKNVAQLLDIMQKVILLIRTHLEVFKAHWSFYLRTLQLNNEADLISHRMNAYEIKLTMTIRLKFQAASSMHNTVIEVQAGDFIGELRAEVVRWWFTHVDRSFLEQAAAASPSTSPSSSSSSNVTTSNQQGNEGERGQYRSKFPSCSSLKPFTEYLLANHHSLRLLSQNQEIPFEWDERQINELDFKEMHLIYILSDIKSTNADPTDDLASNQSNDSTQPAYLPKTEIPSILLLRQEYFERLMEADRFLGSFKHENPEFTNRAKALSRRVWEIIQILPTCTHYKADLRRCGLPDDNWRLKTPQCAALLSAECPQRLLYSLQIIDILRSSHDDPSWGSTFIKKGGLADLFDVFMSQRLLPDENEDWNEWLQECLAYLLKLLFQFGTKPLQSLTHDSSSSSSSSKMSTNTCSSRTMISGATSIKRIRRNRTRLLASAEDRLPIPHFSEELLRLLSNTDLIFTKLIRILKSSALCRSQGDHYYFVTMSSRAMIIHHIMGFLSSWCKSDLKFPKFNITDYEQLLKALILDDTDSSTRREACNGFFKLHHACSTKTINTSIDSINSTMNSPLDSSSETSGSNSCVFKEPTNWAFSTELLKCLIKFLPIAEAMTPPKPIRNYVSENDYIKELNSPGCKDYFWLTCRLIDSPATTNINSSFSETKASDTSSMTSESSGSGKSLYAFRTDQQATVSSSVSSPINLFQLCEYLVVAIRNRKTYETRDFSVEDDTLRGMLMMMVMALRRDPSFRYTDHAYEFIHELYEYLFAPPTQSQRYLPKCKSPATRSTAFDLIIALVERCPKNYFGLLELLLLEQHNSVVKGTYPSDYWPQDDCRSEVGFVGLVNLGATCYLATCMQHLFMIPNLRYAILSIEDTSSIRHGEIIRELQKIFTFMLESERKAYNPRNFCKVYTMDNHPLNIAEQTDMTEFLTDLITKLEESSPELRQVIKGLFSGTLSNNVVSLDCPHISRTTEEFYTLRVQVADMRNLNDSLDELTVKDTLEGDNMYTCSTCEKKVRAEKRACIVRLPRILCFNTMRYTFNMATMTKEKVNTHFSFPLKLDMADYLETNLMKRQQSSSSTSSSSSKESNSSSPISDKSSQPLQRNQSKSPENTPSESSANGDDNQDVDTMYELIGVTVHTGNADGGHYYCFIRDCEDQSSDKPRWYLFNDAEVKPFDDSHIGTECYGGELTTKSYDAINDRFMDFSIEKTNSAYMLFYKRKDYQFKSRSVAQRYLESDTQRDIHRPMSEPVKGQQDNRDVIIGMDTDLKTHSLDDDEHSKLDLGRAKVERVQHPTDQLSVNSELDFNELCQRTYEDFVLPRYLSNWIWFDNMKFARDRNVFEHNYFNFLWQICANLPRTLNQIPEQIIVGGGQSSSASFHVSEDALAIRTVHLAIAFVLGVLMNSRERPNLSNWTELIRKQFNSSKAACDWLTHLIDDEETWLKQMLLKCPIEMVRQLFQRLCNDLTGPKQHKKLRLIR